MCNCKSELEEEFLRTVKNQLPDSTGHYVEIGGYAFAMTNNLSVVSRQFLPVTIKHTVTNKKTGAQKQKVEKQKLLASFCMFCGKKMGEN